MRLVLAAADEAAAPMPIASLIRDNLISGIAQGLGRLGLVRRGASRGGEIGTEDVAQPFLAVNEIRHRQEYLYYRRRQQ